jgi:hypothetical protein
VHSFCIDLTSHLTALLGILLASISRIPAYVTAHHNFLVSTTTLTQVYLTDLFANAAAFGTISSLAPRQPAFRRPQSVIGRLDFNAFASWFLGIALATFTSALVGYLADHVYLYGLVKRSVLDVSVPAYFSANRPPFTVAQKHPLVPVPILRSDVAPLRMPEQLVYALPLSILLSTLVLFVLPHAPNKLLAGIAALLTFTSTTLTLWNIFPVRFPCAISVGLDVALRSAASVAIIAWVLEDVRRPLKDAKLDISVVTVGKTANPATASPGNGRADGRADKPITRSDTTVAATTTTTTTTKTRGKPRRSS